LRERALFAISRARAPGLICQRRGRHPPQDGGTRGSRARTRLARRIVDEALDPDNGVRGAELALKTLDAVDPLAEASFSFDLPSSPEDVEKMSYEQLKALLGSAPAALEGSSLG
jgi:hypothetical protein